MTRKQIDASREVRLWLGQIIIPAVGIAVGAMNIPEVRTIVVDQTNKVKRTFKKKFKKEDE